MPQATLMPEQRSRGTSSMKRWFVYCGAEFYPYHAIIEAESAVAAVKVFDQTNGIDERPIAVFPLNALAYKLAPGESDSWPVEAS